MWQCFISVATLHQFLLISYRLTISNVQSSIKPCTSWAQNQQNSVYKNFRTKNKIKCLKRFLYLELSKDFHLESKFWCTINAGSSIVKVNCWLSTWKIIIVGLLANIWLFSNIARRGGCPTTSTYFCTNRKPCYNSLSVQGGVFNRRRDFGISGGQSRNSALLDFYSRVNDKLTFWSSIKFAITTKTRFLTYFCTRINFQTNLKQWMKVKSKCCHYSEGVVGNKGVFL